jgi:iron complex outermembrane recepter protein
MKVNRLHAAVVAALTGASGLTYQDASAQDGLEEILVTATRRSQDVQEVPVSIVAITGDSLEVRGIQNLEDAGAAIPNINIQGGGNGTASTQFRMRGIPGVGTYVDGVWQINTGGFLTQEFVDVDRIEVLRGPQGTSFGRDSLGGSIRIWTRRPSDEFGGNITATVGSLDRRDVKAAVDVPFSDNFKTKWTAASLYRDGYIQSLNLDQKNGGIDQQVLRGDMLWTPTEALSLRFIYSDNEMRFTEPRIQDGIFNTAANMGQAILLKDFYQAAGLTPYLPEYFQAGFPGGQVGEWENKTDITLPNFIQNEQMVLDVQLQLSDSMQLQFLTANNEATNDIYNEWDNSPYVLVNDYNREFREVFSEEIQLSGERGRINWVTGLYYWDQEVKTRNMRHQLEEFAGGQGYAFQARELGTPPFNPANLPAVVPGRHRDIVTSVLNSPMCTSIRNSPLANCESVYISAIRGRYDNLSRNTQDGFAVFGGLTISLTDKLDLNVGARYHEQDNSDVNCSAIPGVTAPTPLPNQAHAGGNLFACTPIAATLLENSFDKVTGNLSLQRTFTEDLMGYISWSQGFDSGGISAPTIDGVRTLIAYQPQLLENIEVGMRSDWLDGRLRLNATVFHSVWEDIQNLGAVFDSRGIQLPTLVTQNVGEAVAEGAEIEMTWAPTDKFTLTANLGLLDTHYTYIKPGTFALNLSTAFAQAPEDDYNVGVQYEFSLMNGSTLTTRLDYNYSSQFWRSLPFLRMSAYSPPVPLSYDESGDLGTVNARIVYRPQEGDWDLQVFGTNLTDEYLLNSGFFHGIWGYDFATVGRPREVGASLNFRF